MLNNEEIEKNLKNFCRTYDFYDNEVTITESEFKGKPAKKIEIT